MSKRTILSRPRTRVYDTNYNIGESLYRPALDRLDRKYSGRSTSPPRQASTLPSDLLERHERAFLDDDLDNCRRRAEKHITGETVLDSRRSALEARDTLDNLEEETISRINAIRANKRISLIDDVGVEGTANNISAQRFVDRTEKILDAVGIGKESASRRALQDRAINEELTIKRRSVRINQEEEVGAGKSQEVCKWSAIQDEPIEKVDSAASIRAKQSRARLSDLDDEMEAIAERQHNRERKAARLRALVAEVADNSDVAPPVSARKSVRIREEQALAY